MIWLVTGDHRIEQKTPPEPEADMKNRLMQEIETLPEKFQADVFAFVRFLKIGLADEETIGRQFSVALEKARALASERRITEEDIAEEIQAVRSSLALSNSTH